MYKEAPIVIQVKDDDSSNQSVNAGGNKRFSDGTYFE